MPAGSCSSVRAEIMEQCGPAARLLPITVTRKGAIEAPVLSMLAEHVGHGGSWSSFARMLRANHMGAYYAAQNLYYQVADVRHERLREAVQAAAYFPGGPDPNAPPP